VIRPLSICCLRLVCCGISRIPREKNSPSPTYVNTDVTSPDFLQPVDNSGSGDNSTKTTTAFVPVKYPSEAVTQTITRTQQHIAFLVK
jgi:hypothetical protein